MPPRQRSRRVAAKTAPLAPATVSNDQGGAAIKKARTQGTHETAPPTQVPGLAKVPLELFEEILCYFEVIPPDYYHATYAMGYIPSKKYAERSTVLRALSQTCRSLRDLILPYLWKRIETWWVPEAKIGTWYKYVMEELERKATGVTMSEDILRSQVRMLVVMMMKPGAAIALPAFRDLLQCLPNLHTIQVLHCNIPGDFTRSVAGLSLPNVRTVIVASEAHSLLKACPNATHVRCAGGDGASLLGSLKFCKVEIFDGMVNWTDAKTMIKLVSNASTLVKIEIRRPVNNGLGILSQNKAPPEWAQHIPILSKLGKLQIIQITFPGEEDLTSDLASIAAARQVLLNSKVTGKRKLIIRRVLAPHYTRLGQTEDVVHSYSEEVFE